MFNHVRILLLILMLLTSQGLSATPQQILGLGPRATTEEIKAAHRKLGKKYHPDTRQYDEEAAKLSPEEALRRFKEVQEAFEVLSGRTKPSKGYSQPPRPRKSPEEYFADVKADAFDRLRDSYNKGVSPLSSLEALPFVQERRENFRRNNAFVPGSRDEATWEGISEFLKQNLKSYFKKMPSNSEVEKLRAFLYDEFLSFNRKQKFPFSESFGTYLRENAKTQTEFHDALKNRILEIAETDKQRRYKTNEKTDWKGESGKWEKIYDEKFSGNLKFWPEYKDFILNELKLFPGRGYRYIQPFLDVVAPTLAPREQVEILGEMAVKMGEIAEKSPAFIYDNALLETQRKIDSAIKHTFESHPDLKEEFRQKSGLWNRLLSKSSSCDLYLGKVARQTGK